MKVVGFLISVKFSFFLLHMHKVFIINAQNIFTHTKDTYQNMCHKQYSMKNGHVN